MITKKMIAHWVVAGILDKNRATTATSSGHVHIVGEVFKSKGGNPAEYRRRQIKRTRVAKQKRKGERLQQKLLKKG